MATRRTAADLKNREQNMETARFALTIKRALYVTTALVLFLSGVTRLIDRCRSNEVRRSHQSQGPGRQILNLGMLFSANVPVDTDLCAMVWSISRDYAWGVTADVSSGRTTGGVQP